MRIRQFVEPRIVLDHLAVFFCVQAVGFAFVGTLSGRLFVHFIHGRIFLALQVSDTSRTPLRRFGMSSL